MHIFDRFDTEVTSTSTPTYTANLVRNLAELKSAVEHTHSIITRVPAYIENESSLKILSTFAKDMLTDGGIFVLVGNLETLSLDPRSIILNDFDLIATTLIEATKEVTIIFRRPSKFLFGTFPSEASIQRFLSTSNSFVDYADLVSNVTAPRSVTLLPFSTELKGIEQVARDLNRTYISANCAAKSVDEMVNSMVVCK